MSKKHNNKNKAKTTGPAKAVAKKTPKAKPVPIAPEPVDVVDGMPDVSPNRAIWKYIALALAFAIWVAYLIYCSIAGN